MRYLLRSLLCVSLSFCIVFLNSYSALASTTTPQVYNLSLLSLDSAQIRAVSYNNVNDTFKRGTLKTITPDAIPSLDTGSFTTNYISSIYSSSNYEYGIEFVLNDISYDANGSLELDFNGFVLMFETLDGYYPVIDFGSVYPTIIEADVTFSGSKRNILSSGELGSTWSSFSNVTNTYPLQFNAETRVLDIKNFSAPRMGGDMTLSLDTTSFIGSTISENSYNYQVVSADITDITFRVLFPVDYYDLLASSDIYYSDYYNYSTIDNRSFYTAFRFTYDLNFPKYELSYVQGSTSTASSVGKAISSLSASVSSKISSMSSSISNKITTSTNTITTKIDTMSQNIQTGLQNVIASAQQNTQNIINAVTTKVDEVKTGIIQVKDSILDLPTKISEMLIGLVVPDEQAMIEQKEQWDTLLAERFGVVYESVEVMDTVAGSFTNATQQSTITLPSVTVPLANEEFTFGGYDVEVVPEGFGMLADALKLIIDIVVTLAFINAMKNRYEQLVSR